MTFTDRLRAAVWRVPVGLQLSALYTLLLVAILALLGAALYARLDQFLVDNTAARLEQAATAALYRAPGDYGGRHEPRRNTGAPGPTPPPTTTSMISFVVRQLSAPDVTVAVLDRDGNIRAVTPALEDDEAVRTLPVLPAGWLAQVGAGTATQWVVPAVGGGRQLVLVQPITSTSGGTSEHLLLVQAASLALADDTLGELRLYLVLGILIGTIVGVLAGLGVTRAVLQPLDRMARTAEAIAGGDLNRRLRMPPGGNEVARLGGAFDHMVERLAATLGVQRRFIADASHELRTPLTSLEGLSEMLLIGADRGDSGTIQRMARSMHGELGRMGRLVTDLLTLSRLDSAVPLAFTAVEAGFLLDSVAEQMAPLADARHIRLDVAHPEPLILRAEPDRLKQVLLNLVDNALRYTPPEGVVRLTATRDPAGGRARIEVRDSGPGIAPADLPHIFDRFYRGDPSRARASGNTGLGLAIARALVEAHGGTIAAASPPGGGACFTITLPATPPGDSPPPPVRRDRQPIGTGL